MERKSNQPNHLAWHETLEIHELIAFQSVGLMKLKDSYANISDSTLKNLYKQAIEGLSGNIEELLKFLSMAPTPTTRSSDFEFERNQSHDYYIGDLLALIKSGIKNYAVAITETATPALRTTLKTQLTRSIDLHAKIFNYMQNEDMYPAYDFEQLLKNDTELARKALQKSF